MPLTDHPLRHELANELHARPFPALDAPGQAAYLALGPEDGNPRDPEAERAHLLALLDWFGAPHPQPGATHWSGQIGRHRLKWESHTEFVSYMILTDGASEPPFREGLAGFPADWLEAAPGRRLTSALVRVELAAGEEEIARRAESWFVPESLALSRVLDDQLMVAGDFRIDAAGHMRFAVFARPGTGGRRIGRVVQRLCEIETYKAMAMLGLAQARRMGPEIAALEAKLSDLASEMAAGPGDPAATLAVLLSVSSELEELRARSSFRSGATRAYETLVNQRIGVLRETRFGGRQTFAEFMMRRFDPAMRTVESTDRRLAQLSERAARAADLLRTRVDVERSAQNQELLASMDRRADMQLRLQRTVEGLSVVAISYYAVSLAAYLFGPVALGLGIDKAVLTAVLVLPVAGLVWLTLRRIRQKLH
ncbi:DUF3422 family protein [Limimaricola pyoseonensis]|uniref:Uncharacterized membrane-anchored protein n=1 Tax=Limimaricola pyoseonensis TaxID=521013 RepID=A0A1G6ZC75_9RHOB|nr:DUF3422 domain-containing protein [Limimaricola pyoseonensis]SDE00228.1 Uncharacterized membrane-anchored protein [Limimaricola pyoseonensis]